MTSTALTAELDAVNTMLTSVGEAPVSSLSLSGQYPLDQAKSILSEVSRAVQSSGWAFNTEEGFTATRDGSNQITLPASTISFVPEDSEDIDPVLRGLRLYDRKAHSYTFTKDVTGTLISVLGWDELPQVARQYITIAAAKTMQGRTSVPDSTYRYTQEDLDRALVTLTLSESREDTRNMLNDSWSVGSVVFGRDLY